MFCCTLLYVHSSIIIILMGKRERELVALLNLSSWCLVKVEQLFLPVPRGCLRFVIVGRTSGLPGAVYDVRLNLNVLLVK